jgi:hypothetical protein
MLWKGEKTQGEFVQKNVKNVLFLIPVSESGKHTMINGEMMN